MNLHIRLTRACNASCAYCSCGPDDPVKRADLPSVTQVADGIAWLLEKTLPRGAWKHNRIDMEIVGGEVLLLPMDWLAECVEAIQQTVGLYTDQKSIGCQSNLIAGPEKVRQLVGVFGVAIGTSTDHVQDHRKLAGSADNYRKHNDAGRQVIESISHIPGVVWVCTGGNEEQAVREYEINSAKGRSLTLREAFQGVNHFISVDPIRFADAMIAVWNLWFMQGNTLVSPHHRIVHALLEPRPIGCPWWRGCAGGSIDMDANGDVYVCQELNDAGLGKLGNAFRMEWDDSVWNKLAMRRGRVERDCLECDVYDLCQGGCMMEVWQATGDIFGRPPMCPAWKKMFRAFRQDFESRDRQAVSNWFSQIAP